MFQYDEKPYCSHCYLKMFGPRGRQTHTYVQSSHLTSERLFFALWQVTGDDAVLLPRQQPKKPNCFERNAEEKPSVISISTKWHIYDCFSGAWCHVYVGSCFHYKWHNAALQSGAPSVLTHILNWQKKIESRSKSLVKIEYRGKKGQGWTLTTM